MRLLCASLFFLQGVLFAAAAGYSVAHHRAAAGLGALLSLVNIAGFVLEVHLVSGRRSIEP